MKNLISITLFSFALLLFTGCTTVSTSGDYALSSGETLRGNLIMTSGNAHLAEGSRVTGHVIMTSGVLSADGAIDGDILFSSGKVNLGPHSVVHGDIRSASGTINRAEGARVEGQIRPQQSTFTLGSGFVSALFTVICALPLILLGFLLLLFGLLRRKSVTEKSAAKAAPAAQQSADETAKLRQLKQMLDEGLITAEDYEHKKADILAEL